MFYKALISIGLDIVSTDIQFITIQIYANCIVISSISIQFMKHIISFLELMYKYS